MTGYEAFAYYNSLKLHFSSDKYDFFKYQGKSKISVESFEKRKDKYYFYKLSRKYDSVDDYIEFLVSNFLVKDKLWAGDLTQESAETTHNNRMKIIQSLTYSFKNDCNILRDSVEYPVELIKTNGDHPLLLKKVFRNEINLETLCIMDIIMGFTTMWNDKITDSILWPKFYKKFNKYKPFLEKWFETNKYRDILKSELL